MSKAKRKSPDRELRLKWFSMLLCIAWRRRYRSGWAHWAFKARFGEDPGRFSDKMLEPTAEVLLWVRDWQIHSRRASRTHEAAALDVVRRHRTESAASDPGAAAEDGRSCQPPAAPGASATNGSPTQPPGAGPTPSRAPT